MSLTYQHLIANSPPRTTLHFHPTCPHSKLPTLLRPIPSCHVTTPLRLHSPRKTHFHETPFVSVIPKASPSHGSPQPVGPTTMDLFLSLAEILCIFSAGVVSISYAANCTFPRAKRTVLGVVGSDVAFAWGMVVLIGGVAVGAWIRTRRRQRVRGGEEVDLVARVEKLEEDLRSSRTIIRVLSRQLEKLGVRFRVTRKSLKQPIAETAALAQKNSEATQALAVREDILEKELGEIQKVLLAMQEQQRKQLELILVIGKTGRLWDTNQEPNKEKEMFCSSDLNQEVKKLEIHETPASSASMGTTNDRP